MAEVNYQVNQQMTISCVVDCAKTNIGTAGATVMKVPKNFVITHLVYEETSKATASKTCNVKLKTADTTIGSFTTGAADPVSGCVPVSSTVYAAATSGAGVTTATNVPKTILVTADDEVTIATASSSVTAGRIRIGIVGFSTGMTASVASAGSNTAPADPYTPPEKA